jgi:hypothetical protein
MAKYDFLNSIGETPIFQYIEKYGDKRASQNALSSLRMKHRMPGIREKQSEEFYTIELILEAHNKCKTWSGVLKYLKISHELYTRLCKKYEIEELKADRRVTTKLAKQHNVEVWKLVEEEIGLFDSTKKAADSLDIYQGSIHRLASNRGKKDKGKINAAVGPDGSLYTFEFTGNKISDGTKRDPSKQIRAYKLYEVFHKEYDSINDADIDLDVYFAAQLKGICEQTGGYKIYKK